MHTVGLSAKNVTCYRDDWPLFQDISLHITPGDALQITGENGSGKTTLLRILCGLSPADEGTVFWDDHPIAEARQTFYSQLLYIGHQEGIKGNLTPIENLQLDCALNETLTGCSPADALHQLQLVDRDDVYCHQLSAGQKRRVALARLLLIHAKLWILDEPFTALDVTGRNIVEAIISQHLAQGGMAIFTTHQRLTLSSGHYHTVSLSS